MAAQSLFSLGLTGLGWNSLLHTTLSRGTQSGRFCKTRMSQQSFFLLRKMFIKHLLFLNVLDKGFLPTLECSEPRWNTHHQTNHQYYYRNKFYSKNNFCKDFILITIPYAASNSSSLKFWI